MHDMDRLGDYHYYVCNAEYWRVDTNLIRLLNSMKKVSNLCKGCYVYRIPLKIDAEYEINFYVPQVEGVVYLGYTPFKGN